MMTNAVCRIIFAAILILTAYFGFNQNLKSLIIGLLLVLGFSLLEFCFTKLSYKKSLYSFAAVETAFLGGILSFRGIDEGISFFNVPFDAAIQIFLIIFAAIVLIRKYRSKNSCFSKKDISKAIIAENITADMSAFEDGRIYGLLNAGFISGKIIMPDFLLNEIRNKSQSNDNLKKYRARRALDIANKLKESGALIIKECRKEFSNNSDLTTKIISFSLKSGLKILTADFNFVKSASLQKARIFNLLELSDYMLPIYVPGDSITVFLSKEGEHANQAVGFLPDGSMIIAEDGKRLIGKKVKLTIVSLMQGPSGRIFFTKPSFNDNGEWKNNHKKNGDK